MLLGSLCPDPVGCGGSRFEEFLREREKRRMVASEETIQL